MARLALHCVLGILAGAMNLTHRALEPFGELPVFLAILRVAIGMAVGVIGLVFLPQQHERHALATQFVVDASVVGLHLRARSLGCDQ